MIEKYVLIAFESTNSAIYAEKILRERGAKIDIVPLLPQISAGCGLAIKIDAGDVDFAKKSLIDADFSASFFSIEKRGLKKDALKLFDINL